MISRDWETFFGLYNSRLSEAFDSAMERYEDEGRLGDPDFDGALRNDVLNGMQAWYKAPLEGLGEESPEDWIGSIGSVEEAIRVFELAAVRCDDDIPEYLKIKLASFGGAAGERLTAIALAADWAEETGADACTSEAVLRSAMALKILGEWGIDVPLEAVVEQFGAAACPAEYIADAFKSYIEGLGTKAVPALTQRLGGASAPAGMSLQGQEYMLIALTAVGRTGRDDRIYSCLRSCFRRMENKVIAAICLGDYGDPRGIAVLKSFLDNPDHKPDRQLFYEILSSIRRLGGEIHDIKDPFGDFSLKR